MDDDLHDALTDIKGVGDATADEILATVADYERARSTGPRDENGDPLFPDADGTGRLLEKAIAAAHAGEDRDAAVYLRRATGE